MSIVVEPKYPKDIEEIKERTNLSKKQYVEFAVLMFNSMDFEERIDFIFDFLTRKSKTTRETVPD